MFLKKYMLIYLLAAMVFSCGKKDNILDSDKYPYKDNNIDLQYTTKKVLRSKNVTVAVDIQKSEKLELGKYKRVESNILLHFPDLPDSIEVTSAYIKLMPGYVYGAGTPSFDAYVYEPVEKWAYNLREDIDYFPIEYGSFTVSGNVDPYADSVFVDVTLVNRWLKSPSNPDVQNNGILIKFDDNASFMKEYYSVNALYKGVDYIPKLYFKFERKGVVRDSIFGADSSLFLIKTEEPDTTTEVLINNFTGYRSILFFDISEIPTSAIVNKATLYFDTDADKSNVKDFNELLSVSILTSSDWDSTEFNSNTKRTGKFTESTLEINVRDFIANWVYGNYVNNGFILYSQTEGLDARYFSLKKTQQDSLYSPRLEVFYSVPPEKHFEK